MMWPLGSFHRFWHFAARSSQAELGTWESPRREVATTTADPIGSRDLKWLGQSDWAAENVRQTALLCPKPTYFTYLHIVCTHICTYVDAGEL